MLNSLSSSSLCKVGHGFSNVPVPCSSQDKDAYPPWHGAMFSVLERECRSMDWALTLDYKLRSGTNIPNKGEAAFDIEE